MQKVIRRTILAEKQAARRLVKRKDKNDRTWRQSNRQQTNHLRKEATDLLKTARFNRREDWELGPLAPRRDVGDMKDKFGTVSQHAMKGPILEKAAQEKMKEAIGGKYMHIVLGDRVVILEGRDKGKIGVIKDVDLERCEFTIEGLNMIDIAVPKWMVDADPNDQRTIRPYEKPVPFNKVKLVHPLKDPQTGITRDVIVKEVTRSHVWVDKLTKKQIFQRKIAGLNTEIPWPEVEEPEYKTMSADTWRIEVETKTFMPTLLTPPMPMSVIDELRNKYSIFRTRHDPEYIAMKEAEDEAEREKKRLGQQMRMTPLKEYNKKVRKENKAKGNKDLSDDMKIKIGQLIAEKRQIMLQGVGMS